MQRLPRLKLSYFQKSLNNNFEVQCMVLFLDSAFPRKALQMTKHQTWQKTSRFLALQKVIGDSSASSELRGIIKLFPSGATQRSGKARSCDFMMYSTSDSSTADFEILLSPKSDILMFKFESSKQFRAARSRWIMCLPERYSIPRQRSRANLKKY
jgi:hypothetical protein